MLALGRVVALNVHRAAAPSDPLDRPGNGQGHRHLSGLGAAHLAGAQTAAAPAAHVQTIARSGFAAKLTDIVGLYVDPPAHAVALSIDEKARSRRSIAPNRDCRSSLGAAKP